VTHGARRHIIGKKVSFSMGEAFSLDDRGWKAAPTKKISPYLEKNKKKSSLIFRLDFFLTGEMQR
jgi:hypothetical protein